MKGAVDVDECVRLAAELYCRVTALGVAGNDITLNRQRRPTWVVIPHGLIVTVTSRLPKRASSHDTVVPTVDRTRLGGSLEAVICWRRTGHFDAVSKLDYHFVDKLIPPDSPGDRDHLHVGRHSRNQMR
jgi:hypothetical protein